MLVEARNGKKVMCDGTAKVGDLDREALRLLRFRMGNERGQGRHVAEASGTGAGNAQYTDYAHENLYRRRLKCV